jgi:hypothetical protein
MRKLSRPASPSHINLIIMACVITMSIMSIALIWQAQVIANQQESLRWLEKLKFGGD